MRRKSLFISLAAMTILLLSHAVATAQVGQLRGQVTLKQADGQTVPAAGAAVDVFRTDLPGTYNTKADKKGNFVFAGLPYVGTYIISVSAPNAQPKVVPNVKAGREIEYSVILDPGDGKRLTKDEARVYSGGGGGSSSAGGGGESAEERAKREELIRKNAEIEAKNKKITESNEIVGRAFKAGNEALMAKRYDEAITQYNEGLTADPEQPALLTNKALAHKARGVDRYNAAVKSSDQAAQKSGLETARSDFREAAEASQKAVDLLKAQPAATDPAEQTRQNANKLSAFNTRAESMRLFVTKVDQSQADAGMAAYQDYLAIETDAAKKSKAQLDAAQMLFDAGAADKALAEYRKILAVNPDDADANLGAGLALYGTGDKAKYQEAANYLQRFVDKAPDTHNLKQDAKAVLEELKNAENIKPQKTAPARRRG